MAVPKAFFLLAAALSAGLFPAEGARAGVKLSIEVPERIFRPGREMVVRFTIENDGETEARLDEPESYLEGLEVRDGEGRVVKAAGRTRGITKRSPVVEPRGFIGRAVDIAGALSVPEDKEGWYRLRWSFGDAVSNEARVLARRDWLATVETNHGAIAIEFLPEAAPNHVLNFLRLARSGFYEGSTFHRIIPGFMMQGGIPKDPANTPKTTLQAEFSSRKHVFGTVSMARTPDPDSATCQFFICFAPATHLDLAYSAFGQVVKGEETVKGIEKVKTDHSPCKGCGQIPQKTGTTPCCGRHHQDRPEIDVVIKGVTLAERKK